MSNLDALLAAKAFREEKITGVIKFKIEGGEVLEVKKLSPKRVLEAVEHVDDKNMLEVYDELIYDAIPELHNLIEEYECKNNPVEIVGKFFTEADRLQLGRAITEVIDAVSVERIKN